MPSTVDVTRSAGVTYRQVDYWCRSGYVRAPGGGSGRVRSLSDEETGVVVRMARLVAAGVAVPVAAKVARAPDAESRMSMLLWALDTDVEEETAAVDEPVAA